MIAGRYAASSRSMIAAAWLAALPSAGCGMREDVDLDPVPPDASAIARAAPDGPAADVSATDTGAESLPDASTDSLADASGESPDAPASGETCILPATRSCQENGASCQVTTECCSLRCLDGDCLAPGTCTGPWDACTTRASCCSGRCEPIADTTYRMCLDYCLPVGAPCGHALDCCSTGCHGGVCAAQVCAPAGGACATNADCCSGICPPGLGTCVHDAVSTCSPPGETCAASGVAPCCDTCDPTSGTCALSGGPCVEVGTPCVVDSDCCRGTCTPNPAGIAVCTAPCFAMGASCATSSDCCAGRCMGLPPTCGPLVSACRSLGAACTTGDDCCSSQCIASVCVSECGDP